MQLSTKARTSFQWRLSAHKVPVYKGLMNKEGSRRLELARELSVGMNEEVMACCLCMLEMDCCPESLALIFSELDSELCN